MSEKQYDSIFNFFDNISLSLKLFQVIGNNLGSAR